MKEEEEELTRVTTIGVPKSAPPAIRIPQGLPVLDLLSFTITVCFLVMFYSVLSEQRSRVFITDTGRWCTDRLAEN